MSDLNYENLLKLVQDGKVAEVDALLNVSNAEIVQAIGPQKYDELLEAGLISKNAQMVKILFKHSNLITKTPDDIREYLVDGQGKVYAGDDFSAMMDYVKQWERATSRSNIQKYQTKNNKGETISKGRELRRELEQATKMGFNDLADRIQRRLDFEQGQHNEREGLTEAGQSLNRWMDEKSWILDGAGRLEYDMYGQDNRDEIIQALKDKGIVAQPLQDEVGQNQFSNYRLVVQSEDVAKLQQLFKGGNENLETVVEKEEPKKEFDTSKDYAHSDVAMDNPDVAAGIVSEKAERVERKTSEQIAQEAEMMHNIIEGEGGYSNVSSNNTSVEEEMPPQTVSVQEFTDFVSRDEIKDFVQKIHQVNANASNRDASAGDLEFFLSDKNKDSAMMFMDAIEQAPYTRASRSSDGSVYIPDNEFAALNANEDFSKAVFALELMAWSGNKLAINRSNESAERAKKLLKALADKDYVQAQISYAFLLAGDKKADKAEIEKYVKLAEENQNTPDYLKDAAELKKVKEILNGADNVIWPYLIQYPEVEKTVVPQKEEEKPQVEQEKTVIPQKEEEKPQVEQEKTRVPEKERTPVENKQPTPKKKQQTPKTPEEELAFKIPGYASSWDEDRQNGRLLYDIRRLSPEAQKLARDILKSYDIPYGEVLSGEDKGLIYVRSKGEEMARLDAYFKRVKIQEDAQKKELPLQPKPGRVDWVSPALANNWCCHEIKSGRLDMNKDTKSFHMYPTTWYFKPKNDQEREAVLAYLTQNAEIDPKALKEEMAMEDMNKCYKEGFKVFSRMKDSQNPIKKGERVIAISDPKAVKKLMTLWEHTTKAPEIANPPKGMLPDANVLDWETGKPVEKTLDPKEQSVPQGQPSPEAPVATGHKKEGSSKVLDSLAEATKHFMDSTFGGKFATPEDFGQEMLYQICAFPLEWLDAYLQKVGLDKGDKGGKGNAPKTQAPSIDQTKAIQAMLKKMVDKDIADDTGIFQELVDQGLVGAKASGLDHKTRVENLKKYLNDPANAELKKKLKNNFAAVARENPDLFRAMYPADYKGPYTPDVMLEHLASWQMGKEETQMHGAEGRGVPQPELSDEAKLIAELGRQLQDLKKELSSLHQQLDQLSAENAELNKKVDSLMAERDAYKAENDAMKQMLQDLKNGKMKPEAIQLPGEEKAQPTPEEKPAAVIENNEKTDGKKLVDEMVKKVEKAPLQLGWNGETTKTNEKPDEAKAQVSPTPKAEKVNVVPEKPTKVESDKPKTDVIRDLDTLAKGGLNDKEVLARLDEVKTNDTEYQALVDLMKEWYQTPADKRKGTLNDLITSQTDAKNAKNANEVVDDGYDETTGIYTKVVELHDSVQTETKLAQDKVELTKEQEALKNQYRDVFEKLEVKTTTTSTGKTKEEIVDKESQEKITLKELNEKRGVKKDKNLTVANLKQILKSLSAEGNNKTNSALKNKAMNRMNQGKA